MKKPTFSLVFAAFRDSANSGIRQMIISANMYNDWLEARTQQLSNHDISVNVTFLFNTQSLCGGRWDKSCRFTTTASFFFGYANKSLN